MPNINEAISGKNNQLAAELAAGVNILSGNQAITFTRYTKMILPSDGFVFWVRDKFPVTTTVQGSLHYSTEIEQEEDSNIAYNTMVFTALSPIDVFLEMNPQNIYIGVFDGIMFGFSSTHKFYQQADLYHYFGVAIPSIMQTQIINDISKLDLSDTIVSNSLPIWLGMPAYVPPYPGFRCNIPLYPSFLGPLNLDPIYGSVHIEETEGLAASPFYTRNLTSQQLCSEKVRVTLYGANNLAAVTFKDFVLQYSADWNFIGMLENPAVVNDEKKVHSELGIIAQKKTLEFEISYLQSAARNVARQFILHASVSFLESKFI